MCEMLVRVVDKVNEDLYLDAQCLKRGDVVVICPDGWNWSAAERKNPDWRIVQLPKVSELEASSFLGPELDEDPANPSKVLRRRAFKLDVDAVKELKDALKDDSRAQALQLVDIAYVDLARHKVGKVRLTDPAKL